MVNKHLARTIIGVIGNIISFGLFLSPVPTFIQIWRANSVKEFKEHPYIATLLNCAMWVFYGLPFVKSDSILVSTINGIGVFIELCYVMMFIVFSHNWHKRRKIFGYIIAEILFCATVFVVTLTILHGKKRSMTVGIICLILNVIMYFSPMTAMYRVYKTKSVKYMPFYLSLANFANGSVWFAYAFLKFDPFVVIPNGLGALSGLIQLGFYAYYYRSTNWVDDDDKKPSEVQLSNKTARV